MIDPFSPSILRLRVQSDGPAEGPDAIVAPRPRGLGPYSDAKVAEVRRLIEQTTLSHAQIKARTGVSLYCISVWRRDFGWTRPLFAPRATDTVPTTRASRRLKQRLLAQRLNDLAERYLRELEATPDVDLDKLMQALQVYKMARYEMLGRHRRRRVAFPTETGATRLDRDQAIRTALKEIRRQGVDLDRARQEALDLVIDAATPIEDHPALRPRGSRRK